MGREVPHSNRKNQQSSLGERLGTGLRSQGRTLGRGAPQHSAQSFPAQVINLRTDVERPVKQLTEHPKNRWCLGVLHCAKKFVAVLSAALAHARE